MGLLYTFEQELYAGISIDQEYKFSVYSSLFLYVSLIDTKLESIGKKYTNTIMKQCLCVRVRTVHLVNKVTLYTYVVQVANHAPNLIKFTL